MEIRKVTADKRKFLLLLLLADEEERMIDRYLDRGEMYVVDDGGVKSECVVTDEGGGVLEIKNLATLPSEQGKGYASALIEFVAEKYKDRFSTLRVGTGRAPRRFPSTRSAASCASAAFRGSSRTTTKNRSWTAAFCSST